MVYSGDMKRPIILPRDHQITSLLVKSYHKRYHHHNHETVISELLLVIVVDEKLTRNTWPKGRVLKVKDGQVRRATVQTKDRIMDRPAVKIAVLDVL